MIPMKPMSHRAAAIFLLIATSGIASAETPAPPHWTKPYNVTWTSQSKNSSESMPCGGHDIGLNVWVENGDILFYMDRSGSFDENNQMLKLGRVRLSLSPDPFSGDANFTQTLDLETGSVTITGKQGGNPVAVTIWVETGRPVIHADVVSEKPVELKTSYENWRTADHELTTPERAAAFTFSGTKKENIRVVTRPDTFEPEKGGVLWFHRNDNSDLTIDKEATAQHLDDVRDQLWNPQKNHTFGGLITTRSDKMPETSDVTMVNSTARAWSWNSTAPSTKHSVTVYLHAAQSPTVEAWKSDLRELAAAPAPSAADAWQANLGFWREFWDRSHIQLNPDASADDPQWRMARNYQVFRYQLGCNAAGKYPTKFNGSLFTFDPVFVNEKTPFKPDFRRWGGGSFTLQNQRLVYWPLLKTGDFDLMLPQFDFFVNALPNAELRTKVYWNHGGASFTEQMENYGLPTGDIYESAWGKRPIMPRPGDDHGRLMNNWCEDQYDTVIEFLVMIADYQQFTGKDVSRYLPLMSSVPEFFDQHYRYQNKLRTGRELDDNGKLVIFPGSAAETYKQATNSITTTAGLRTLLTRMLELPENHGTTAQRARWKEMLGRIPPTEFREIAGRKTISPARDWQRINNREIPQLYPVFPFNDYGVGKPDLQVAIDTYDYGVDKGDEAKGIHGWRQDPIWMARLGLTDRAASMISQKLADSGLRFPTFWGPNFDWTPDFNHGGSAMIALEEMLMQTDGKAIRLLPTWPKEWNVKFKLHAPFQTTVEAEVRGGKLVSWKVTPPERAQDVIVGDGWK